MENEKLKTENRQNKFRLFGFTLIELLISLVIISLIASAFVPVISKKLKNGTLSIGVGSGGAASGPITLSCETIDEECKFCAGSECYLCNRECPITGTYLDYVNCKCKLCASEIENVKTCEYNKRLKIPVATLCKDDYYIEKTEGSNYGKCMPCPDTYHCDGIIKAQCDKGEYMNNEACASCPKGHKCDGADKYTCPIGTYQNQTGQAECLACPDNKYADEEGLEECKACPDGCKTCDKTNGICMECNEGYELDATNNICNAELLTIKIGSDTWITRNAGDNGGPKIPAGVQICQAGYNCSDGGGTIPTCWQGATSGACTEKNGYSGCNRTVCNWYAANMICSSAGGTLPTSEQIESINYPFAQEFVELCDGTSDEGYYSKCAYADTACDHTGDSEHCYPYSIWSSEYDPSNAYYTNLTHKTYKTPPDTETFATTRFVTTQTIEMNLPLETASKNTARSVRCVVPDGPLSCTTKCHVCENGVCKACIADYKLQDGRCVQCAQTEYCPLGTKSNPESCSEHFTGCNKCNATGCTQCSEGTMSSDNQGCCQEGCLTCNKDQICTECPAGQESLDLKTCVESTDTTKYYPGIPPEPIGPCSDVFSMCHTCNTTECTSCNGNHQLASPATACTACPAGWWCPLGTTSHTAAPASTCHARFGGRCHGCNESSCTGMCEVDHTRFYGCDKKLSTCPHNTDSYGFCWTYSCYYWIVWSASGGSCVFSRH